MSVLLPVSGVFMKEYACGNHQRFRVIGESMLDAEIATNRKLRVGSIAVHVVGGLAEPVGQFIANELSIPLDTMMYPNPEAYVQSFGKGEWDIAIGPRVLAAADKADVGDDLWLVDLIYVAAPGHRFRDASQVDKSGINVGVVRGSPSDRYLSHNLKFAQLVRIPLSPHVSADASELLRSGRATVIGVDSGIGYAAANGLTGATIVPGTFTTVPVAVALPKGRSPAVQAQLAEIIKEAKQTGIIQKAIEHAALKGVRVAP
jgi:polar amino acid transport system substrate-binding protein